MNVIGIHDGHNASVAAIQNGRVIAACQEERLSRVKNQGGTPVNALEETLRLGGIDSFDQVDKVVVAGTISQPPYITRTDVLQDYADKSRFGKSWLGGLRSISADNKLFRNVRTFSQSKRQINQAQSVRSASLAKAGVPLEKITFIDHHTAHASSAYYGLADYDDQILVLTNDGAGDGICATVSIGNGGRLKRISAITEDNSVATIYAMVTYIMGMTPLEHEYKIMGLAPYYRGDVDKNPVYQGLLEIFEWDSANPMQWCRSTGIPRVGYLWKYLDELLTIERFDTIAAGVQAFVEYFLVEWVRRCIRETGLSRLAVSGGTFMNVKANQAILSLPEVDELFVFPSCGDETNSVGAAYWYYANQKLSANERVDIDSVGSIYWGGEFHDNDIESILDTYNFTAKDVRWEKHDDVEGEVAELLAAGQVVARFKGRMEFGARALGNRSILANASQPNVVRYINDIIKSRDFWMPFAPSVLADYSADYFHKPKSAKACYMVMSFDTISNKRNSIFAAVHPQDGTARPQEVYPDDNPEYELLLRKYQSISGDGAILNTSFNLHGYPLVYSPDDALKVFDVSGLEYLALGNFIVSK